MVRSNNCASAIRELRQRETKIQNQRLPMQGPFNAALHLIWQIHRPIWPHFSRLCVQLQRPRLGRAVCVCPAGFPQNMNVCPSLCIERSLFKQNQDEPGSPANDQNEPAGFEKPHASLERLPAQPSQQRASFFSVVL